MNAPLVISASRRTDIPAFYSDWFMSRMIAGYCEYVNPFNLKRIRVDLSRVKCVVFWTKNPGPMIKRLHVLDGMGVQYYFQYTLNNYDDIGIEPELSNIDDRIETFKRLSEMIGKEKVIFRFDPLILVAGMTVEELVDRVLYVAGKVCLFTEKMVFSFADLDYRKVQTNLFTKGFRVRDFSEKEMIAVAESLSGFCQENHLKIATCSEGIDLSRYGIEHNKCIDPDLIMRITGNNPDVAKYITGGSGQRNFCGCAKSVDIGLYDTCIHNCAYCYATRSHKQACDNYMKHLGNTQNSSIV